MRLTLDFLAASGGGGVDWTLVLALVGTVLASAGLLWNILDALADRRDRKTPKVHGVIVTPAGGQDPSEVALVNAGRGVARSVQYLYVGQGHYVIGGHGFLLPEQVEQHTLDFRVTAHRSTWVWAYMDVDGRVWARSNDGQMASHPKGVEVSLRVTFAKMYPDVPLPPGRDQFVAE